MEINSFVWEVRRKQHQRRAKFALEKREAAPFAQHIVETEEPYGLLCGRERSENLSRNFPDFFNSHVETPDVHKLFQLAEEFIEERPRKIRDEESGMLLSPNVSHGFPRLRPMISQKHDPFRPHPREP